jgi:hypothetical protein
MAVWSCYSKWNAKPDLATSRAKKNKSVVNVNFCNFPWHIYITIWWYTRGKIPKMHFDHAILWLDFINLYLLCNNMFMPKNNCQITFCPDNYYYCVKLHNLICRKISICNIKLNKGISGHLLFTVENPCQPWLGVAWGDCSHHGWSAGGYLLSSLVRSGQQLVR